MTDKQCERVKGREDDGEWLIIDLCDDNGVFSFSFHHRDVTWGADLNRFNEIGSDFDVFITSPLHTIFVLVCSAQILTFIYFSFHINTTDSSPSLPAPNHLFPPTIINHYL
jgi:hypothetical protein